MTTKGNYSLSMFLTVIHPRLTDSTKRLCDPYSPA